jgi:putative peptide zinc metalloprotease protein
MNTFSESWHRVRGVTVRLRPQVQAHRQRFRGELWFVVREPFNNQFFRLRASAYAFVQRLDGARTVQEAWEETMADDPEEAPGQQDVIELLARLYAANLIFTDLPADTAALFQQHRRRHHRETVAKWVGAMFARFPLWDPDDFLRRVLPVVGPLFSRFGAIVWAVVVLAGLKGVIENRDALFAEAGRALTPENLLWLYLATVGIKLLHEFGHAILCRKFGGEVHTFGVMLMVFTPMPYVDATSAWSFRECWQRVIVGAGGMIVEVFIAGWAALFWAASGPGLLHALAFNVMFSASVSTLLFNLNPLLRFDGYYMLMDWLRLPNLAQRSLGLIRYLAEKHFFGLKREKPPAHHARETPWLIGYGVASFFYRIALSLSIILFVATRFPVIGVLLAGVCLVGWVVVPLGRFVGYLATSPRLARVRPRAWGVTLGGTAILVMVLGVVPMPSNLRAPGVVQAEQYTLVATANPGFVEKVLAPSGNEVKAGQPLLQLADPELVFEVHEAKAQLGEAVARQRQAISHGGQNQRSIDSALEALRLRGEDLRRREGELTIKAAHDGLWVAPRAGDFVGRWFPRGTVLGEVVNPRKFTFIARIPTRDGLQLISGGLRGARVRLLGQPAKPMEAADMRIIQATAETDETAGGRNGADREKAPPVPTFELRSNLVPGSDPPKLLNGQTGVVRLSIPWEPLLQQWSRRVRQLFQKAPGGSL